MTTANVLDLSHYNRDPDFASLAAKGIIAIIHKATQGTSGIDAKFIARSKAASAAGMPFYGYHFGDSSPAEDQADHFLDVLSRGTDVIGGALDFEDNGSHSMGFDGAVTFLLACDTGQGFLTPIYGGNRIRELVSPAKSKAAIFAPRMLWLAEYGPHERIPAPWRDASKVLWQFSETGSVRGIGGHVDLNHWPGTADTLQAAWTSLAPRPPTPT